MRIASFTIGRTALLLAALAPAASHAAPLDPKALAAAVDAYAKPLVAGRQLSGQLLVSRHGRIVLERAYGWADFELRVPVTAETRFNIASVTKPMTTTVAFQLMAEKKLGYRDTLSRWLPDFPSADRITVEQLLRHRSGIPHEVVPDSEAIRPMTAAEVVERVRRLPLDFPPGEKSSYSSGGFSVLARVLELAGGKSYGELLEERLFRPLGMGHSSHADSRALLPGRARSYVPGPHGFENAPPQDYTSLVGAGSVTSTARDLHRFVQAVIHDSLTVEIRQSFLRGGKLSFNGRTNGFLAWATYDSASGLAVVFAGNLHTGAPELLKDAVPRLAAGEALAPPELPTAGPPVAEAELRKLEGVYQIEGGPRIELRVRDGVLYANDWIMTPTKDGAFFSPRDYGTVKAVNGADGRFERLDWTVGSQTWPARRIDG